jgi:hypothetical protein
VSRSLQWKLIGGFVLVFIAGGVTGAFLGGLYDQHLLHAFHHRLIGLRMKERLRMQLKLTPEQLAEISPIIDKTAVQLKRMRRDTAWRAHEVIVGAHQELAANLTDEQRLKLQQIDDRHRHQLRGRRLADPTPEPSASP